MCRSQGRGSLVQDGGLLWAVRSGCNVMQGQGQVRFLVRLEGPVGRN